MNYWLNNSKMGTVWKLALILLLIYSIHSSPQSMSSCLMAHSVHLNSSITPIYELYSRSQLSAQQSITSLLSAASFLHRLKQLPLKTWSSSAVELPKEHLLYFSSSSLHAGVDEHRSICYLHSPTAFSSKQLRAYRLVYMAWVATRQNKRYIIWLLNVMRSGLTTSFCHYGIKFLLAYQAIVVQVCSLDHFLQLRVVDVLSHLFSYLPQIFYGNEACFCVVKQAKYSSQAFLGVSSWGAGCQQFHKLTKINRALVLSNCMVEGLVPTFIAKSRHAGL